MHWSLDQVRNMTVDDFNEVIAWLKDLADRDADGESMDVDALIEAKRERERRDGID